MKICILTAGKGIRMAELGKKINKTLLPVEQKSIISKIIESFSKNDEFVIAIGHLGEQVKNFLEISYPERKFEFVNVKNFSGKGSGPGLSLFECKKKLQEPFVFVAGDGIYEFDSKLNFNENFIGVAKIESKKSKNYCNVLGKNGFVIDVKNKKKCSEKYFAFSGFLFVKDYEIFWNALKKSLKTNKESEMIYGIVGLIKKSKLKIKKIKWEDLGSYEKYTDYINKKTKFNFEKSNEFIYFIDNKVVKFFVDPSIVKKRIQKTKIKQNIFPRILDSKSQFYSYSFHSGKTFYEHGNPKLFKKLLKWLEENVWSDYNTDKIKFQKKCKEFYLKKSIQRINSFKEKYPDYIFPKTCNQFEVLTISEIFAKLPWKNIFDGKSTFIHGDLQFDNIIYDKKQKKIVLIDWRQDFAGLIKYGDMYYDLAKLHGGIILNYDLIKKGLFQIKGKKNIQYNFSQRKNQKEMIKVFYEFCNSRKLDIKKIRLITGLIYLNMAPLHHFPFDKLLISLGIEMLSREIKNEK